MSAASRLFLLAVVLATCASAGAQPVLQDRCDKWNHRSRASVDVSGLPDGQYYVRVTSGSRHAADSPLQAAVDGEVQFDFDSSRPDIVDGAASIARSFIVRGKISVLVIDETGFVVTAHERKCRAH